MIALLGLSIFVFRGGDAVALAVGISKALQRPAVVSAGVVSNFGAVNASYDSAGSFGAAIERVLPLHQTDSAELAFSQIGYPTSSFVANISLDSASEAKPLSSVSKLIIANRSVTSPGAVFTVGSLEALKWSRPLHVHWFLRDAVVAASGEKAKESTFLRLVSLATGAGFYEDSTCYRLDLDPGALRIRAKETFRRLAMSDTFPFTREDASFASAAYESARNEDLLKAYETPESVAKIPMGIGSPLYRLALDRLKRDYAVEIQGGQQSASTVRSYQWIQENVDFSQPGYVEIRPKKTVHALLKVKGAANHWFVY